MLKMRPLPNEIWYLIIEYIQAPLRIYPGIDYAMWYGEVNPVHTLLALSRTSKFLHEITQPFIYHRVGEDYSDPDATFKELNFFGTRPHLARLVQHLCIRGKCVVPKEDLEEILSKTRDYLDYPKEALDILERGIARAGDEEVYSSRYWDQLQAPFLLLCSAIFPNITTFKLSIDRDPKLGMVRRVEAALRHVDSTEEYSNTLLPNLRRIIVHTGDTESTAWVEDFTDLFFPQIEEFHGWDIQWTPNVSLANSRLEKICLYRSQIEAEGVTNILFNCPKLRILRINWMDRSDGEAELNLNHLGNALRQNGLNLEELKFEFWRGPGFMEGLGKRIKGRLGSLQKLDKLRKLSINMDTLIGSVDLEPAGSTANAEKFEKLALKSCLPGSLECLTLYAFTDDLKSANEQLDGLEDNPQFDKLESIALEPHFASSEAY